LISFARFARYGRYIPAATGHAVAIKTEIV